MSSRLLLLYTASPCYFGQSYLGTRLGWHLFLTDLDERVMRRSNRNFNQPPPPGHLTIFCAREAGNLTGKDRVENLPFAWVGWGKLNNFEYKQP